MFIFDFNSEIIIEFMTLFQYSIYQYLPDNIDKIILMIPYLFDLMSCNLLSNTSMFFMAS